MFVSEVKHFLQILVWRGEKRRCPKLDAKFFSNFSRAFQTHIVALHAFFSAFGSVFESADFIEKILYVIFALDIFDSFDVTDFLKCFESLVVFFFRLDIRVIPKTDDFVCIFQINNRDTRVGTTTYVQQKFWFFLENFFHRSK